MVYRRLRRWPLSPAAGGPAPDVQGLSSNRTCPRRFLYHYVFLYVPVQPSLSFSSFQPYNRLMRYEQPHNPLALPLFCEMRKLIFCVLIGLPAAAGTITTVSGACIANDGYTQSWSYQLSDAISSTYTCTDPAAVNQQGQPMTATFTMTAFASINAAVGGQNMVSAEVWGTDNQDLLFPGHEWTNVEETVSVQEQETFVATGGSGQAFLEGMFGVPLDDGLLGSSSTSFGGCSGCSTPTELAFAPIPFTFGQPLTLFMDATASHPYDIGSINDGKAALVAQVTGIVGVNGDPISGVQFTPMEAPEPTGLGGLGVVALILAGLAKRARPAA